jgi:GR25 family glycosyltransferase involved in LPS biosynthesis
MRDPWPLFVINLDDDTERLGSLHKALEGSSFEMTRIPAVSGKCLPDTACTLLAQHRSWVSRKGEIGCFLSHVKVWEAVQSSGAEVAVVLEDDVAIRNIDRIIGAVKPMDCDLVFINDRMSPGNRQDRLDLELAFLPMDAALRHLNHTGQGVGSDGYVLTQRGAGKLLETTARDLYFGNIDWRLLRYSVSPSLLNGEFAGSRVDHIIRHHHNPDLPPAWGILTSYCLNTPLVAWLPFKSRISDVRV